MRPCSLAVVYFLPYGLFSHDPTHWAVIQLRKGNSDHLGIISLTFQ